MVHESPRLAVDTVVYYNDVESEPTWRRTVRALQQAQIDAVDFYYIREHEVHHPELSRILPRLTRIAECVAELRQLNIHCGIALLPSLGWGQVVEEGSFEKITGPDGTRSGTGACPLDPRLGDYLEQIAAAIARTGVDSTNLEDDFQNNNHRPVRQGCYCPRHLQAFGEISGRSWTREQLVAALAQSPELTRRWATMRSRILVDLMVRLHRAAAAVQPAMKLTLLAGADVNFEPGPFLDTGLIHRWRPTQLGYVDERTGPLECAWRGSLLHDLHGRPRGLTSMAEVTSWPRNSYTKSWATIIQQGAANAFLGIDRLLLWLGHGLRDPGFQRAIGQHRRWFDAIARSFDEHPQPRGLAAPTRPKVHRRDAVVPALARMGIPMLLTPDLAQVHRDDPILLAATDASVPDGVPSLAGRPLVLDAAGIAVHGGELGLRLRPVPRFFSCEQFSDDALYGDYRGMYSSCLTHLQPQDIQAVEGCDGATALAHYLDNQSQIVTPSVLLDHARRRLIFNHSPTAWNLLVGFGKAHQLRSALAALLQRSLCAAIVGAADVALLVRDSDSARAVLVFNLSYDAAIDWRLALDFQPRSTAQLHLDGAWQTLPAGGCPARGRPAPLPARTAVLWRFER